MQKGKQALLLHLGVCLHLCNTILLPCRCLLHLTTLPHISSALNLFFRCLLTHFIYPSYICSLFRFPTLCEGHASPAPPLHLCFSPFLSSKPSPPTHAAVNSPDFLFPARHAPTLMWELRYYACGVVALAWGSVLRPRGVLLFSPLETGGTGQCAGLEG